MAASPEDRNAKFRQDVNMLLNLRAFAEEVRKMRQSRAWWATNDPVAYVWLCRAERRGALVPWSTRIPEPW